MSSYRSSLDSNRDSKNSPASMRPMPGAGINSSAKKQWWYHNTTKEAWERIQLEGLDAGSFSERPIDFGGDVWIKVRESDIPIHDSLPSQHQYGDVVALEPCWKNPGSKERRRINVTAVRLHRVKRYK